MNSRLPWHVNLFLPLAVLICCSSCAPETGEIPAGSAKLITGSDGIYSGDFSRSVSVLNELEAVNPQQARYVKVIKKSTDPSGNMKVPDAVIVNGKERMVEQCGVYRFEIYVNGEQTIVDDFRYSGERLLTVARGLGWYILISRDEE